MAWPILLMILSSVQVDGGYLLTAEGPYRSDASKHRERDKAQQQSPHPTTSHPKSTWLQHPPCFRLCPASWNSAPLPGRTYLPRAATPAPGRERKGTGSLDLGEATGKSEARISKPRGVGSSDLD